jgi:tRNA (cytidine32/uridine32-2'-O)-methyltransferase
MATAAEVRGLLGHLRRVADGVGFLAHQPGTRLFRRVRRLFARARPTRDEVNILRGILSAIETRLAGTARGCDDPDRRP